jgi:flagellin-like protein
MRRNEGGELFKLYIMNKHFNNRAVSEIIAALLLIAIAVAAAVLLYVFSIGLLGSLGSSGGQQTKEQVIMEAYTFPSPGTTLTVTLRNVGSASENLLSADYFVAGIATNAPSGSCTSAVTPGGSCVATLTGISSSLISNAAYPFKVVTPTGGVFSYTVIYGGSS